MHGLEVTCLAIMIIVTMIANFVLVNQQKSHFNTDHAFHFIERWNEIGQYQQRIQARSMLAEFKNGSPAKGPSEVAQWLRNHKDREAVASFYSDINLLTELAQAYLQDKIDREYIDSTFGTVYPRFLEQANALVVARNKDAPLESRTWQSFLAMCFIYETDTTKSAELLDLMGHEKIEVSTRCSLKKIKSLRSSFQSH